MAGVVLLVKGSQPLIVGLEGRPFGPWERLFTEFRVVLHQLSVFFLPLGERLTLTPYYPISRGPWSPPRRCWRRRCSSASSPPPSLSDGTGRGVGRGPVLVPLGHLMESTFLPLDIAFPHRSYLPTVLAFLPLALLGLDAAARRRGPAIRAGLAVAALAVLGLFAAGTLTGRASTATRSAFWRTRSPPHRAPCSPRIAQRPAARAQPAREALAAADDGLRRAVLADAMTHTITALQVNRGIAFGQLNRVPEAIAAIREAVRLQPEDLDCRYNLAVYLLRDGRLGEAAGILREVVAADPTYPRPAPARAALERQGRREEAMRLVDEELRVFPRSVAARQQRMRLAAAPRAQAAEPRPPRAPSR